MKSRTTRRLAGLFAAALLAFSVFPASIFAVDGDELPAANEPVTIQVTFFDDINKENLIPSTEITVTQENWDQQILEDLQSSGIVEEYTYSRGRLSDIVIQNISYPAGENEDGLLMEWNIQADSSPIDPSEHTVTEGEEITWLYAEAAPLDTSSLAASNDEDVSSAASDSSAVESTGSSTSSQAEESALASSEVSSLAEQSSEPPASSQVTSSRPAAPVNPNRYEWNDSLAQALDDACSWLRRNDAGSFQLVALGAAGRSADTRAVEQYMASVSEKNGSYATATELETDILSATFSGLNANDVRGIKLIDILAYYPEVDAQGVNGAVYALLALDSNNYQLPDDAVNTREALIEKILSKQREDGGFSLDGEVDSEVDITALCLTALASYRSQSNVQQSIQKALDYLSGVQRADGQFLSSDGNPSLESLSQVIVALNCLEIAMDDRRFAKGEENLVDLMLEYRQSDGGFSSQADGDSNVLATEHATLALAALRSGMSPYTIYYSSSPKSDTPQQHNNILFYVIIGVFALVLIATALGFVYFRVKHRKEQLETEENSDLTETEARALPEQEAEALPEESEQSKQPDQKTPPEEKPLDDANSKEE